MKLIFLTRFEDDSFFVGDIFAGDWRRCPEYKIKSISLSFLNKKVKLENYEKYNILVERYASLGNKTEISKILFIGRGEFESDIFEFNIKKKVLFHKVKSIYMEIDGQLVSGWKEGIKGLEEKSYVG